MVLIRDLSDHQLRRAASEVQLDRARSNQEWRRLRAIERSASETRIRRYYSVPDLTVISTKRYTADPTALSWDVRYRPLSWRRWWYDDYWNDRTRYSYNYPYYYPFQQPASIYSPATYWSRWGYPTGYRSNTDYLDPYYYRKSVNWDPWDYYPYYRYNSYRPASSDYLYPYSWLRNEYSWRTYNYSPYYSSTYMPVGYYNRPQYFYRYNWWY